MQRNWTGKNMDLDQLTTRIGEFFKQKDFNADRVETEKGYQIFAEDSKIYKLSGYLTVAIEGKPDDFTVKLELSNEKEVGRLPTRVMTSTMFGFGFLVSRRMRMYEDWLRFRRDFWMHISNTVTSLSGSAHVQTSADQGES